jgi:uncharacterized protein
LSLMDKFRRRKDEEPENSTPSKLAKIYIKALSIQDLSDLDQIKAEIDQGNIIILKVTPLAKKNLDDVKRAISHITSYVKQLGGDIARLGEERVIIAPPSIKIWKNSSLPKED